jgi:hypothetical protein
MEEVIAGRPSTPGSALSDSVCRRVGWEETIESPDEVHTQVLRLAGGRVQVYGCAPGCLVVSLVLSVALTILVNVLIRLF